MMDNILNDVAKLQSEYQLLIEERKLTKKNMCELVIPFRDKYGLTDLQALRIARAEMSVYEINAILNKAVEE